MNSVQTKTISKEASAKALALKIDLELANIRWSLHCIDEFTKMSKDGLPLELATNNCPESLCCDICGEERFQDVIFARVPMSHVRNGFICEDCLSLLDPELHQDLIEENEKAHREVSQELMT